MGADETPRQRDRHEAAAEINAIYTARRASGLKDGDTGFGAIDSSREHPDWRHG